MLNYVQAGNSLTIPAAPHDLESGAGCLIGSIFGVATGPVLAGLPVVIQVQGVFTLPKVSALAIALGDPLYWDNAAMLVTETGGGNTRIGVAVADAANPSPMVNVRLNGSF